MSYVDRIACWRNGATVLDGEAAGCTDGDYPEVHYDLSRIAREIDRDALASGSPSLWRYAPALPLADDFRNHSAAVL